MAELSPDTLNEIGVLKRREIEARILMPVLEALGREFGRDKVFAVARDTVIQVAREQGRQVARKMGGNGLEDFARSMGDWTKGDALEMDVLAESGEEYAFNVTRCRYAELYRVLGIADVGALFSSNRDFSLIEGFNPDIELTRTQTIMQGAGHCDFRYRRLKEAD